MKIKRLLRKVILATLMSCLPLAMSYGQAALLVLILGDKVATENFHLSIDVGMNFSSLPDVDNGKTIIGLNFGLGTHIKLSDKWHLKPEFKPLSQKGVRDINAIVSIPDDITPDETRIKLNYIDVPILFQYNVTPVLSIAAGPQISFLTDASQNTTGTINGSSDVSFNLDTRSTFNKIDLSFPVEVGYSVSFSTKKSTTKVDMNVFARYSYGFIEVFDDPSAESSHNSTFQIGASFPFIKSAEELAKKGKK